MKRIFIGIASFCALYASAKIPTDLAVLGLQDNTNMPNGVTITDSIAAHIIPANVALAYTDIFNPYRDEPCDIIAAEAHTLDNGISCVTFLQNTVSNPSHGDMFVVTFDKDGRFVDFLDCGDFHQGETQSTYAASIHPGTPVFMKEKGNSELPAIDMHQNSFTFSNRLELMPMNTDNGIWYTAYNVTATFRVSDNGIISRDKLEVFPDQSDKLCSEYIVWDHWLRSDMPPTTILPSELHQRGSGRISDPTSSPTGFKVSSDVLTAKIIDDNELFALWDSDEDSEIRYPIALSFNLSRQAELYPDQFFALFANDVKLPDETKYKWLAFQDYSSIWLISDTGLRESIIAALKKYGDGSIPARPALPVINNRLMVIVPTLTAGIRRRN